MTNTLKNTAIATAILFGSIVSTASADIGVPVAAELITLGFSADVISQLNTQELSSIENAMMGENYSDAHQTAKSLILQYTR